MTILVDSLVWIDFFAARDTGATRRLKELIRNGERLALGDLMLAEVLQGVRDDGEFNEARSALLAFEIHTMVSPALAVRSAENFRALRRRGSTVRTTVDSLIATYVIEGGHQLLHSDRDFDPFARYLGLQVVAV